MGINRHRLAWRDGLRNVPRPAVPIGRRMAVPATEKQRAYVRDLFARMDAAGIVHGYRLDEAVSRRRASELIALSHLRLATGR